VKKFAFLAVLFLLVPAIAGAQVPCPPADGTPYVYVGWPYPTGNVYPGQTWTYDGFAFANIGAAADTFCFDVVDQLGWTVSGDVGNCELYDAGYAYGYYTINIDVPCDATIGQVDTLYLIHALCDVTLSCRLDCDPTSRDTMVLTVVEAPPALYVTQDTLSYVEQGQTAAYVPFSICNGDPCAGTNDYAYNITSLGTIGSAIDVTDTVSVSGGECQDVYGVIDAGSSSVGDKDTLTIIAWSLASPVVYDTCVQAVEVVSPVPVPLFTAPVITVLVLALVLAAAVFMRKRARAEA